MQGFIGGFLYEKLTIVHGCTILPSGCIFTRFAITNVTDTIWNMWTILFAVMATIDFNLALRLILVKFTRRNNKTQRSLPLRFIVDSFSKSKLMFVTLQLSQYDEF